MELSTANRQLVVSIDFGSANRAKHLITFCTYLVNGKPIKLARLSIYNAKQPGPVVRNI